MSDNINIGDSVEWTSSAAGTTKTKRGKVVAIVPAKGLASVVTFFCQDWRERYSASGLNSLSFFGRGHESYLIAVPTKTGRGRQCLYWPRTSQLRKVDSDEQR